MKKNEKQLNENAEDLENLSDDELYAKIQTEKLVRKKKKRKIATAVAMCVSLVFIVALIIMAAVPVSLQPNCIGGDYYTATIIPGTTQNRTATFVKGQEGYDKFDELLNNSFSQSFLSALFGGNMFDYDVEESSTTKSVSAIQNELISNQTYFVKLHFNEDQLLTQQNGKAYVSNYRAPNSTIWDGSLHFSDAFVVVNKTEGYQDTKIYLAVNDFPTISNGEVTGHKDVMVTITVRANTYEIYDAWNDLLDF
ncbi:MAG: hypothetical protein E7375_04190 [Clostridiales bacterium]|nr:hypothetical protein [Clostridiales bacterium]